MFFVVKKINYLILMQIYISDKRQKQIPFVIISGDCFMMTIFNTSNNKFITWFKRIGIAGVLFFLLKGLAWLALGWYIFD